MLPFSDFKFASDLNQKILLNANGIGREVKRSRIPKAVKGRTTTQCKEADEADCTPRLVMAKTVVEEYGDLYIDKYLGYLEIRN